MESNESGERIYYDEQVHMHVPTSGSPTRRSRESDFVVKISLCFVILKCVLILFELRMELLE